ncbi:hypothetical protein CRG98_022124 [Punica granatum]|uniref:DNA ligase ATP-dependent C-terminal domain-containing protein n=1 Tax=Punica granatum TaxID=22663 RepID=A0A2I0JNF7_PUNGR|nr:hypothetical protein CRG98_022124 [Punica granatum]
METRKKLKASAKLPYFRYSYTLSPDVWFEPTEVWEVKAADLTISPVHRAAVGIVDLRRFAHLSDAQNVIALITDVYLHFSWFLQSEIYNLLGCFGYFIVSSTFISGKGSLSAYLVCFASGKTKRLSKKPLQNK